MRHAVQAVSSVGRWLPLLLPVLVVGCAPPPTSDPAAWERWVHDEVKEHARDYGPTWQQPGIEANVIQFGLDYRDRRDKKRLDDSGVDRQLVAELRAELVRKGVPVDSSDGVSWVDAAAETARNTLCPEDRPRRGTGNEWWIVGGAVGAVGLLLVIWLVVRTKPGRAKRTAA